MATPSPGTPDQQQKRLGLFAQAGLLTAIPSVLLIGPAVGYYLGTQLDRRWSFAPWGVGIGILLGLVASGRVTAQMIRRASTLSTRDGPDTP